VRDLAVGLAGREQPEHLELTRGQLIEPGRGVERGSRCGELFERVSDGNDRASDMTAIVPRITVALVTGSSGFCASRRLDEDHRRR
jgi:hypothetical protein